MELRAERGIPSNRGSPTSEDCVPVLCTHRPSLSKMGAAAKALGAYGRKGSEPRRLDWVKVVTRFL
jgi:hypothetical protein